MLAVFGPCGRWQNITHSTSSVEPSFRVNGGKSDQFFSIEAISAFIHAQIDLALEHLGHQRVAQVLVEAAQDLLAAVEERRFLRPSPSKMPANSTAM